jgi:hypothetical protein
MLTRNKNIIGFAILGLSFAFIAPAISAKGDGQKAISRHLRSKYQAKKVKVPFMWLAKLAVRVVRPAGVKSFSITMFEDLSFTRDDSGSLGREIPLVMQNALGEDWNPVIRVRSKEGGHLYAYMQEAGENVNLMVVSIDKKEASIIRLKFNADRLIEFINNPKIFGVSIGDPDKKPDDAPQIGTEKKN